MKTITISTDGRFRGHEVHDVTEIHSTRQFGAKDERDVAEFKVTPQQAFSLAAELLYVAVDGGFIDGWNVSFPVSADG